MAEGSSGEAAARRSTLMVERDRFIGFAFAAAHLLMEVDANGVIQFAIGARCRLAATDISELVGFNFFDIVAIEDWAYVRELLERLKRQMRVNPSRVIFRTFEGQYFSALLGGCCLPSYPGRFYLSVLLSAPAREVGTDGKGAVMLDRKGFSDILEDRLVAAKRKGLDRNLTLLLIDGFADMTEETTPEAAQLMMTSLDAYLRSVSADGDSAGRLADDRFGVIHAPEVTETDIQANVSRILESSGIDDAGQHIRTWGLTLDDAKLDPADAARALVYTVQTFATATEDEFSISTLEDGARMMLDRTVQRITLLRQTIEQRDFYVVYQPIVDIATRKLHHLEALTRLEGPGSPQEFIMFAESVGMIYDFDLLLTQTVLETMKEYAHSAHLPDVAINLSARTLTSPVFLEQFRRVVGAFGDLGRKLMVEVTETVSVGDFESLNATLQKLRQAGHRVCLDDVGSGSTSFQSLHGLQVDVAKIDGQFVRGALKRPRDMTMLRSIAETCKHLDLELVGEQIEDAEQADLLASLGVTYGQGYLYGRPTQDFAFFAKAARRTEPAKRRPPR